MVSCGKYRIDLFLNVDVEIRKILPEFVTSFSCRALQLFVSQLCGVFNGEKSWGLRSII